MDKKFLLKSGAALALCMFATACSHNDFMEEQQTKVEEFADNFQALVMGGKEVNPNQTWNTAVSTTVSVSVDMNYDEEYNVYIYQRAPLINKSAAFIGHVSLKSGQTKRITIAKPMNVTLLYAACYDKNGHAIVKDFPAAGTEAEVAFGEKVAYSARSRSVTEGYRWSVTPLAMPDLTRFTTGDLIEMQADFNTNYMQADGTEKHLIISDSYNGNIARIQSYANQSVYVTGTWTVNEDQRCTGNSVIVVGPTGKIVVPSGCMLSTNANNEAQTTGMIYVMPGGQIEGDGLLQFSNGTQTYSYNAGYINVAEVNINGGTWYNAGTIGNTLPPALTGPGGTEVRPSKFINLGHAKLASMSGAGIALENACNLEVVGLLELGKTSKMDNNSYVKCGSLNLGGSNNGGIVFLLGENAYLQVTEKVVGINNFGVWGPNTENDAYAYLEVPYNYSERAINWTDDLPSTFCLDKVCAVPTGDYEVVDLASNPSAYIYNPRGVPASALLLTWMNGKKENGNGSNGIDDGNLAGHTRSCIWATSVTVTPGDENCGIIIEPGSDPDPQEPDPDIPTPPGEPDPPANTNWVYYAFEDLGGSKDFDFNDVVIRVSTPINGVSQVYLLAAGGELNSVVTLDGEPFGREVHEVMGAGAHRITNTKSATVLPVTFRWLGEVTLSGNQTPATLPFGLNVFNSDGSSRSVIASRINANMSSSQEEFSATPLYLVINGDSEGKWFWPRELVNITTAFNDFSTWGSTLDSGTTWYMPANAKQGSVVSW